MLHQLSTLIRKELELAFRDPQSRRILILPVILQLALFPFAATLEVKNSVLAIFNQDQGAESRELIERLALAHAFPTLLVVHNQPDFTRVIEAQRALLGLTFPADFSRALATARSAQILAVIDGRRSNSAQIAAGYAQSIIQNYANERAAARAPAASNKPASSNQAGSSAESAASNATASSPESVSSPESASSAESATSNAPTAPAAVGAGVVVVRHWFNPNLDYQWFILPVLVAIIATLGSLIVTSLSIAREREQGTMDQLLVSPLTPALIMIGKAVPAIMIALGQATIIALAAVFVYRVPFHGSVPLLYISLLCFALSLAGFGLFISALCTTQQQAFLGVFSFMVPAIMLSGFIAPVENMPLIFRAVAWVDPLSHFIVIVKGLFLKGYDLPLCWPNLWPLLLIAAFTIASAYWTFRRRTA
jgi:ABC-2 type transport system permease protein